MFYSVSGGKQLYSLTPDPAHNPNATEAAFTHTHTHTLMD